MFSYEAEVFAAMSFQKLEIGFNEGIGPMDLDGMPVYSRCWGMDKLAGAASRRGRSNLFFDGLSVQSL